MIMSNTLFLPDAAARDRMITDLETNFLVEAGAGSGKTTGLVERMLALVGTGRARVDQIAAITFTRKAAAQLRERFQIKLEQACRTSQGDPEQIRRLRAALLSLDRCFIGTIHSFCGLLLRERAVEAGVDPSFQEVEGAEADRLRDLAWEEYLERLRLGGDSALAQLQELDVETADLKQLYQALANAPDITPYCQNTPGVNTEQALATLREIASEAERLLPAVRPENGWDDLQSQLRRVVELSRYFDLKDHRRVMQLLGMLEKKPRLTQNRWGDPAQAKAVETWLDKVREEQVKPLLNVWREYRHPFLVRFAAGAVTYYAQRRKELGVMNFQDLLMSTATLLKEHSTVRRYFAERYTHLLVDEFQDTDPVQAEIVLFLAAQSQTERDWRRVTPRPGALFVVGDPKQSIYRFRRADISIYNQFKKIITTTGGQVLQLTANFRSVPSICGWVNQAFNGMLPATADTYQASFAPMNPARPETEDGLFHGVYRVNLPKVKGNHAGEMAEQDAKIIASWIAWACAGNIRLPRTESEIKAGVLPDANPSDFMILTRTKTRLSIYARALERYGIPYTLSGGRGFARSEEVAQFMTVLRAVADPDDPVHLLGALRGMYFGLPDDLLYHFHRAGGGFNFLREQPEQVLADPDLAMVTAALKEMRGYWEKARALPPAVAVEKILQALGIVPLAASGEMGESRAGNVFKALEIIRNSPWEGFSSTIDRFDEVLAGSEVEEGQIRGGLQGAVRLMNLHKAKGLEAPVVFLADPAPLSQHTPREHVTRDAGGAWGYYQISRERGWATEVLAQPPGWGAMMEEEERFVSAENVRLLYVAATRAGAALVVSTYPEKETGAWGDLVPHLTEAKVLAPVSLEVKPRQEVRATATEMQAELEATAAAIASAARPSYQHQSVTALKEGTPPPWQETGRGQTWGTAVHRLLEVMGHDPGLRNLGEAAARILQEEGRLPEERDELAAVAETLRATSLWARVAAAVERHCEVPLEVYEDGVLLTGTADLMFKEADGWVLVEYKSDSMNPADLGAFVDYYAPQVRAYAGMWTRITGERVKEIVLYFTEHGLSQVVPSP